MDWYDKVNKMYPQEFHKLVAKIHTKIMICGDKWNERYMQQYIRKEYSKHGTNTTSLWKKDQNK